ncbi:hypothetical protein BROUX41_002082 [Berkeleyomyces rouxiae]|uniref:uncharacterized protein n=1 Tax=Berkeleyomyces rouxiae TaxID=2035830 RepID=UPI003B7696C8
MSSSPLSSLGSTPERPTWSSPVASRSGAALKKRRVEPEDPVSLFERPAKIRSCHFDAAAGPSQATQNADTNRQLFTENSTTTSGALSSTLVTVPVLKQRILGDPYLVPSSPPSQPKFGDITPCNNPKQTPSRSCTSRRSTKTTTLQPPISPSQLSPISPGLRRASARRAAKSIQLLDHHGRDDIVDEEDLLPVTSPQNLPALDGRSGNKAQKKSTPVKRRNAWSADSVVTSMRSPLIKANLREILLLEASWDCLPQASRDKILSLFPGGDRYLTIQPDGSKRPCAAALRSNNTFRYDVARYQENIHLGRHNPLWLEDAWAAHRRRIEGYYDKALEDKVNLDWGVDVEMQSASRSGAGTTVDAPETKAEAKQKL